MINNASNSLNNRVHRIHKRIRSLISSNISNSKKCLNKYYLIKLNLLRAIQLKNWVRLFTPIYCPLFWFCNRNNKHTLRIGEVSHPVIKLKLNNKALRNS